MSEAARPWADATAAASLLAVDPVGLGGVAIRARPGPVRDAWLAAFRDLLTPGTAIRRIPLGIADERLLGGLDLTATLAAGRPVAQRGLLAESDGGVVVLAMAERATVATAARLAATLDTGAVTAARDGVEQAHPARVAVVALDEGVEEDEAPPAALLDRLAFRLDLGAIGVRDLTPAFHDAAMVAAARAALPGVTVADDLMEALCGTALALGVDSLRAPLLALAAARVAAALDGRDAVSADDATLAARLVLGPRATRLPAPPQPDEGATEEPEADAPDPGAGSDRETPPDDEDSDAAPDRPLQEVVLEAAQAAIPAGLLALLAIQGRAPRTSAPGRVGALQASGARGRPAGIRRGMPRGARLNVVETLRAAAPWQRLRGRRAGGRIEVRSDDFHATRHQPRSQTVTIFAVDASGSSALNRLAEAKGAVELLLADCYVRRDQVAVIAFRGRGAEILLSPTRSLVRAKRSLAGLPGGGGTPLAAGIDAARILAEALRRRGLSPVVVLLTDGRGNVTRDGRGNRADAALETASAASLMRASGVTALLVDTSPRPQPAGGQLAAAMGATYLPLPYAGARAVSAAVRAATPA